MPAKKGVPQLHMESQLAKQARDFVKQEEEKHPHYRTATEVSDDEWQVYERYYIKNGRSLKALSETYKVNLKALSAYAYKNRWAAKRTRYEALEARKEVGEVKGMNKAGVEHVEERRKQEEKIKGSDKLEALRLQNERITLLLDRTLEQMALALGITDADYTLFEANPKMMLEKTKKIAEDKDLNANFVKLFDKFKEAVVLQRLVSGQSTSAAGKDDPALQDDQEAVVIGLSQIAEDGSVGEAVGSEDKNIEAVEMGDDEVVDEVVQGDDFDDDGGEYDDGTEVADGFGFL